MPELRDDYRNRILDFIGGMRDARVSAEICRCMTREAGSMGYCFVSVWNIPGPGQSLKNSVLFNSRPREYTERYIAKNYAAIDRGIL